MRIAISGFSNSGKTTIFNALTGLNLQTTTYPTHLSPGIEPHTGVVRVSDRRLERLSAAYKPRKTTFATIEYIDYVGIIPPSAGGEASQNLKVFDLIREADGIVHVVRAFEDDSVIHPLGGIDPLRDVRSFETELILGDLEFAEKRLERIDLAARKGKKQDEADRRFLLKCRKALEEETPLRNIYFTDEEKRLMLPYQFLTTMPEIIVLNIEETDLGTERIKELQHEIEDYFSKKEDQGLIPPIVTICGKIEREIAQLPEDEAKAFLDDLGIEEPATERLCRTCYEALGLISFFTVGKEEVKAWSVKNGTTAQKAAGRVHSDMERGFIKAETISFDDFVSSGEDMTRAREMGLIRLEGKDYPVRDGDIINFKFNV